MMLHAGYQRGKGAFLIFAAALAAAAAFPAAGMDLPEGPGRQATIRVCGKCHSPEKGTSLRQSRDEWAAEVSKMIEMGAQGSDEDFNMILDYLAKNFGPQSPRPINMNTATAVQLESRLTLTNTEAAALLRYRAEKGEFKSIDDLKNVPGLDFKKIEARKSRIVF